jgi:predicted aminopeptidase
MPVKTVLAAILLLTLLASGCSLSYLFQAAKGQYRLLHESIPVTDALNDPDLPGEQKEQLRLIASIKEFGEKKLGLKATENYETVFLASDLPPVYTLSASPKDRLELVTWWFPVVGNMPYLGFFKKEKAEEEINRLKKKGFDTSMGEGYAYSTLGWFKDPVTLNILKGTTVELAEVILHEMTHTTLYLEGQGEFNEGLANMVGKIGARTFLENHFGTSHSFTHEANKILEDERIFSSFINTMFDRLNQLYDSSKNYDEKVRDREKIFTAYIQDFSQLKTEFQTDRHLYFGRNEVNNAYLMSIGLYHKHFHLFENFLTQNENSVKRMLQSLKMMESEGGDVIEKIKSISLQGGFRH